MVPVVTISDSDDDIDELLPPRAGPSTSSIQRNSSAASSPKSTPSKSASTGGYRKSVSGRANGMYSTGKGKERDYRTNRSPSSSSSNGHRHVREEQRVERRSSSSLGASNKGKGKEQERKVVPPKRTFIDLTKDSEEDESDSDVEVITKSPARDTLAKVDAVPLAPQVERAPVPPVAAPPPRARSPSVFIVDKPTPPTAPKKPPENFINLDPSPPPVSDTRVSPFFNNRHPISPDPHTPPSGPSTPPLSKDPPTSSLEDDDEPFVDSTFPLPSSMHTAETSVASTSHTSIPSQKARLSPATSNVSSISVVRSLMAFKEQVDEEGIIPDSDEESTQAKEMEKSPFADEAMNVDSRASSLAIMMDEQSFTPEDKGKGRMKEEDIVSFEAAVAPKRRINKRGAIAGDFKARAALSGDDGAGSSRAGTVEEGFADDEQERHHQANKRQRTIVVRQKIKTENSYRQQNTIMESNVGVGPSRAAAPAMEISNSSEGRSRRKRNFVYAFLSITPESSRHALNLDSKDKTKRFALCIHKESIVAKAIDIKEEPNTFVQDQESTYHALQNGDLIQKLSLTSPLYRPPRSQYEPIRPYSTAQFQAMIDAANGAELAAPPRIRLVTSPGSPASPSLALTYTNRVLYPKGTIPQVSPGCNCESDCQDASRKNSCECRKRQQYASKTRPMLGVERDRGCESRRLAYISEGRRDFMNDDPVIECSYKCGCPPSCWNKTIGSGTTIPIDIFWTGRDRGWGIRVAHDAPLVHTGANLGIYAGELINSQEAAARERRRGQADCNYLYDLDLWHILEDLAMAKLTQETTWSVDAYAYGNYTRFANHRCTPNTAARAVYIDDATLDRPVLAFTAIRDIKPGEEITISYYSAEIPVLQKGQTLEEYREEADALRQRAKKSLQCRCGDDLCRGIMFKVGNVEEEGAEANNPR